MSRSAKKARPPRALAKNVQAVLDALPEAFELVDSEKFDKERKEWVRTTRLFEPRTTPGCWLVVAATSGYAIAWGRSEKSVEDAVRECAKAGGRPGKSGSTRARMQIYWQPREAWIAHGERFPEMKDQVGPPGIDDQGLSWWWGIPRLTMLWPETGAHP